MKFAPSVIEGLLSWVHILFNTSSASDCDPGHDHFRDTVYSQPYEVVLVRDAEMEDAQRTIDHNQSMIKRIDQSIRFHQSERRKSLRELAEARKQIRAAKKLPRKRNDDG